MRLLPQKGIEEKEDYCASRSIGSDGLTACSDEHGRMAPRRPQQASPKATLHLPLWCLESASAARFSPRRRRVPDASLAARCSAPASPVPPATAFTSLATQESKPPRAWLLHSKPPDDSGSDRASLKGESEQRPDKQTHSRSPSLSGFPLFRTSATLSLRKSLHHPCSCRRVWRLCSRSSKKKNKAAKTVSSNRSRHREMPFSEGAHRRCSAALLAVLVDAALFALRLGCVC